jgi:ATP synthase protein I
MRKLVMLQLLLVAITSVVFFVLNGGFQAGSAAYGGVCACASQLLLEWRRNAADRGHVLSAGQSIRLLYRTAVERFVLVGVLLALGLGVWRLDPLALITGFIAGQLALVFIATGKTN